MSKTAVKLTAGMNGKTRKLQKARIALIVMMKAPCSAAEASMAPHEPGARPRSIREAKEQMKM
jgi:hypothetical protein